MAPTVPSYILQPMLSFALLPAMVLGLIKRWSLLSITSILFFLSVSPEQIDRDLKSILAVSFEFWFIFFGDWKIAIVAVWLLLMIYRSISEDLSATSAEKWNDIEKEWAKYISWFDPDCSKFRYLKEHIIFTGIKMRFKKEKLLTDQGFESLLKEALAQVKRLSKETVASEDVAKEAAEEDEWEDI
jgi:hypothetical protein